jgi:hypothetical protein
MLETEAGQDAPAVISEATPPATATAPADTTVSDTQTETAEKEPAVERTYSQKEFQDSIERATAKAAAKAERRAYREALQTLAPNQQQPAQQNDSKPARGNFASDEAYIESLTDWKIDQRESVGKQVQEQQAKQQTATKAESIYADAMKSGLDREDLNEVAEAMTNAMRLALIESDVGGKLMAFMAANPDEVTRIASLSPARQAAEIGKLEDRVSSQPKVSAAPPPIKTIGSNAASTQSLENASFDEYKKLRAKQGATWARN